MKFNKIPSILPEVMISSYGGNHDRDKITQIMKSIIVLTQGVNEYKDDVISIKPPPVEQYFKYRKKTSYLRFDILIKLNRFFKRTVYKIRFDAIESGPISPTKFIDGAWVDHLHHVARTYRNNTFIFRYDNKYGFYDNIIRDIVNEI